MFGKRLYQARKAAGLSLRNLGDRIGFSHAAIKKYEDEKTLPSSDVLIKIADALEVPTEYFLRREIIALEGMKFRKHKNFPKKQLDLITFRVKDQIERRMELENIFPKAAIP